MTPPASFREVFAEALRGHPYDIVGLHDEPIPLPAKRWARPADQDDRAILDLCTGPTLDVGCGPGRMSEALAETGQVVLGIDVVGEAVHQTRQRGAAAVQRDVFEPLPAEGHWHAALLADGNVGIGGDPIALLRRVASVLVRHGRIVVEVAEPGVRHRTVWAQLVSSSHRSKPFRWSVVGVDDIHSLAEQAGLRMVEAHQFGSRWCTVLERPRTLVAT
ncbi:MAG: methyltransferase domain-containing protein [Aeromicrobium sp.]